MSDVRSRLLRSIGGPEGTPWGRDPGEYDVDGVRATVDALDRWFGRGRYFEVEVCGWDNLPPAPALLVSNHSGGTTIPDVWGLLWAWHHHFDFDRPLHPLGHEFIFALPRLARFFARGGVLRASRGSAERALAEFQRDVLVMPGGDSDTWRTWGDRYAVHFAGRTGYARLALRLGVPIVPIANAGAHQTLMVLTSGRRAARAIRLKDLARAEVLPIHLSFPWLLGVGPLPHLPTPTLLRYRIGPAIHAEQADIPSLAQTTALDQAVRGAIQAQLDHLRDARPTVTQRVRRRVRNWRRSGDPKEEPCPDAS